MTTQRNELLDALHGLISNADDHDRALLSEALEQYAYCYPRSYSTSRKKETSLVSALLDVLEEASDARIYRNSSGLPDARELLK
jgi:hypothetical protein